MKTLPNSEGEQVATESSLFVYAQLLASWIIAAAIWGYVLRHLALAVAIGGVIGLLCCAMAARALKEATTVEKRRDAIAASGTLWLAPAGVIGFFGLVALVIKTVL